MDHPIHRAHRTESFMTKNERIGQLLADLEAEQDEILGVLRELADDDWARSTPAEGWSIHDQVAHLAHFDAVARMSVEAPDAFETLRASVADLQKYVDGVGEQVAHSGQGLVAWWERERFLLRECVIAADAGARYEWFGTTMSLASLVTARIMETWAHGQDVCDSLSLASDPSARLRHVARIGVMTLAHSFRTHGRPAPEVNVAVVLEDPTGGDAWVWGDQSATQRVEGAAMDFCWVVTRRRHLEDTSLRVTGEVAREWMSIAQAYAGPAGTGRRPGQFDKQPSQAVESGHP
jgi:uncharacterized protein (TIGR03084 family)